MKRLFVVFTCVLMALGCLAQRVILVEKGSTQSLLDAISQANELNADKDAKPLYILIPDGFYDLGERVLTRITGHHIALIGQSMSGTVIQNKPDVKNEGLSKTAVIQNRGSENYFQDLTLKNALDYYAAGAAGRAATLHDKGTHTICNRVRLLSYQFATACDCFPTRIPTIPTTTSASSTFRTRRFTAPSTSSVAMAMCGSSVADWSPRSAPSTAAGAMLSPPPRRRRPSGATSSTIALLRISFLTSSMHEAGALPRIASGSIPLC